MQVQTFSTMHCSYKQKIREHFQLCKRCRLLRLTIWHAIAHALSDQACATKLLISGTGL
jgi:hypothetical protein